MFIYLQPGESYTHTHTEQTTTTLIEGELQLQMGGETVTLQPGVPTPVDAHVTHTLVNIGSWNAVGRCVHFSSAVPVTKEEQP